jgi:cardiolipin synthase (CMP-forming)
MYRWINLPNFLTLIRILLAPVVIAAILHGHLSAALGWFLAAGVTDVIDGAVARRFGQMTTAGAYLDPIADKLLLSGSFLALAAAKVVPWWLVAVILGRDLYILAGVLAIMRLKHARKFPPTFWGKLSTFIQVLTAVSWMAKDLLQGGALERFAAATIWPCAAATIWSGVHYTWRSARMYVRIDELPVRE